jgi:cytochrome c biogenesis protein CcdA
MGSSVFFGGSVVAAVIAGSVSLFAPCCISIMLPAYLSTAFQNRRVLVAMTFLFAAGVATVILPIAVGAVFLARLFVTEHTVIYTTAGVLLVALAGYLVLGGRLHLPMPGRRASGPAGPLAVYSLGAFSGVTSSCCAPVIAGVLALSGAAGSFGEAVGLGSAYVFGMVAPLVVISLLWERFDWRSSRLFRPRQISATLASAVLLAVMGVATFVIGVSRDSMPSARGWQEDLSATVQHWGSKLTHALTFLPGWVAALLLLAVVVLLARRGLRQLTQGGPKGAIEVAEPVELTLLTEADREVIRDDRGGDAVHARDEADYATQEV